MQASRRELLTAKLWLRVPGAPAEHTQGKQVQNCCPDGDTGEKQVQVNHQKQEKQCGENLYRVSGNLTEKCFCQFAVEAYPCLKVSGSSLQEEIHRQSEQMCKHRQRIDSGELQFAPPQSDMFQPDQRRFHKKSQQGEQDHGQEPFRTVVHDVIHKNAQQGRSRESGNHKQKARPENGGDDGFYFFQHRDQGGEKPALFSVRNECFPRFEYQGDSRISPFKFLQRHAVRTFGRIVDVKCVADSSFENDKMVEFPEQDHGERTSGQPVDGKFAAFCIQSVTFCRPYDIGCEASVAGDSARGPQFFQRFAAVVICQNHRKGRRSAFGGFHLKDRRHFAACMETASAGKTVKKAFSGVHRFSPASARPIPKSFSRKKGIT